MTGTLRLREAQQREAVLQFRKDFLQAWHDVDNALVAYMEAQHRVADTTAAQDATNRALAAAEQQYSQSTTSMLHVVTAQQGVLRSEKAVAAARADVGLRLVAVYLALGGGIQIVDAPSTSAIAPTGGPVR